jgi:hypothetical protein
LHEIFNGPKNVLFKKKFCTKVSKPPEVSAEDEKAGAANALPAYFYGTIKFKQ